MCHFVGNFFLFHTQMKLISRSFACSLKKIIHSLQSSTLYTPPAASRRHSYKCGVLPFAPEMWSLMNLLSGREMNKNGLTLPCGFF